MSKEDKERLSKVTRAALTLASYIYAMRNPGEIPTHVRMAMRVVEEAQWADSRKEQEA